MVTSKINEKQTNDLVNLSERQTNFEYFTCLEICKNCSNMSRLAMSCFAATKYGAEKGDKNSTKEKSFERLPLTPVKYNGKMMNSIWGEYNKKSPHNFKKQNPEQLVAERNQESIDTLTSTYIFSLPNYPNFQVETHFEMKKNRPSLERMESLFNFPIFS